MRLIAATVLAGLALATPAAAQTPAPLPSPTFFFECVEGGLKVQNRTTTQSWSETKPAASYRDGAGCGSADPGLYGGRVASTKMDAELGGLYDGAITSMNIDLYSLVAQRARVPADLGARVELLVDGDSVLGGPQTFRITPESTNGTPDVADRYRIAISGLDLPATPGVPREIKLIVSSQFLDYQHAWVWGASEVPGSVQLNPAKLSGVKIKAS